MDDTRAHECLNGVLAVIDEWGRLYERRWGYGHGGEHIDALAGPLRDGIDNVRARVRLARDIVEAMGESEIAPLVVEHEEGMYGGHPFTQARVAIVEAVAILAQREELAEIVGAIGPQLATSQLHTTVWGAAAALWDDGYFRQAVQTASSALESLLQAVAGPGVSGENLAALFSLTEPTPDMPRLRFRDIDPDPTSKTWKSAHEGAAALVRAAFMGVRNLMSHPGWPDPTYVEGLEMLAMLSYVAHLVDRSDVKKAA